MNQLTIYRNVYFLGIGGIGMSALARWFLQQGFVVGGYDKTQTELTEALRSEGMDIHYDNQVGRIPTAFYDKEKTLVVLTPAVPENNTEFLYFKGASYVMMKRSQVLGLITSGMFTIAIAGTHGKTTTSSMTAHVLKSAGKNINAFLGGITTNYNSNLLIGDKEGMAVIEADEYDRSFLTLYADVAVITSMDADHLDIYGSHEEVIKSFQLFTDQMKNPSVLFLKQGLSLSLKTTIKCLSYSLTNAMIKADNIRIEEGCFVFDYSGNDIQIKNIRLQIPGYHNIENALAAASIGLYVGLTADQIKIGLETFLGVKRRFQYHVKTDRYIQIDDYAHHPAEVSAFLNSVKSLYPNRKVTCLFQPHLYSRTQDFYKEFAESLSVADEVILLEIYPARELPIVGVDAGMILDKITSKEKKQIDKKNLIAFLSQREMDVLCTVGAGDIDTYIQDIKKIYVDKYSLDKK